MKKLVYTLLSVVVLFLGSASLVFAQASTASSTGGFSSDGIFGCNVTGAYAMSVGALQATGGVFVPVADASVELNTGYLVYDACVLRPIVDRLREDATAGLVSNIIKKYQTDNNGNPLYPVNLQADQVSNSDAVVIKDASTLYTPINSAFQQPVKVASIKNYYSQTRTPNSQLTCPYTGNLSAVLNGTQAVSWADFEQLGNPACNPYGAYTLANEELQSDVDYASNQMMTKLNWGNGTYDITSTDSNGNTITVTPASLVNASTQQAVTSGFRQTESANDIGQMVGALFTGLSTQILGSGGLGSLTQASGGQPSYIDQVASAASQGVSSGATNAGLQILDAALTVETTYNKVVNAIATLLTTSIGQIRGEESQCWNLIIQNVCSNAPVTYSSSGKPSCSVVTQTTTGSGNSTQTTSTTVIYTIATTSSYSSSVINAQIAPYASSTILQIQASNAALNKINQLLQQVSNTNSQDAQTAALEELDSLTAQNVLHNQSNLTQVQGQQTSITSAMANLIQNVASTWGDGTPDLSNPYDANSGWCNVNNTTVIQMWQHLWSSSTATS